MSLADYLRKLRESEQEHRGREWRERNERESRRRERESIAMTREYEAKFQAEVADARRSFRRKAEEAAKRESNSFNVITMFESLLNQESVQALIREIERQGLTVTTNTETVYHYASDEIQSSHTVCHITGRF